MSFPDVACGLVDPRFWVGCSVAEPWLAAEGASVITLPFVLVVTVVQITLMLDVKTAGLLAVIISLAERAPLFRGGQRNLDHSWRCADDRLFRSAHRVIERASWDLGDGRGAGIGSRLEEPISSGKDTGGQDQGQGDG
jgi:hypothetical protein